VCGAGARRQPAQNLARKGSGLTTSNERKATRSSDLAEKGPPFTGAKVSHFAQNPRKESDRRNDLIVR